MKCGPPHKIRNRNTKFVCLHKKSSTLRFTISKKKKLKKLNGKTSLKETPLFERTFVVIKIDLDSS